MTQPSNQPYPIEIPVDEVKSLLESGEDVLLIDCREQNEYDHCRIEGAVLVPMNETPSRIEELEPHRDKRIVIHCHHGGRSLQVTQYLRQQGFASAQNMGGGIDAWSVQIDSTIERY